MKALCIALALALLPQAAAAQYVEFPRTLKFKDGTITVSRNRLYVRDLKGEFIGTVESAKDGTKTFYDPNGKIVEAFAMPGPAPEPEPPR